jgi:hypothetical protein
MHDCALERQSSSRIEINRSTSRIDAARSLRHVQPRNVTKHAREVADENDLRLVSAGFASPRRPSATKALECFGDQPVACPSFGCARLGYATSKLLSFCTLERTKEKLPRCLSLGQLHALR